MNFLELIMGFCMFIEQRNVMRKQRHWEKHLAAKKSKRKEEKQRRKLNREQESGEGQERKTTQPHYHGFVSLKTLMSI